jgi:hypothetical protein
MRTIIKDACTTGSSGIVFIVGTLRMVPWLPPPGVPPTIKPAPLDTMDIDSKLTGPTIEGETK